MSTARNIVIWRMLGQIMGTSTARLWITCSGKSCQPILPDIVAPDSEAKLRIQMQLPVASFAPNSVLGWTLPDR